MKVLGKDLEVVSCALCDSIEYETVVFKLRLHLVRCRSCGLVFVNPRFPRHIVWERYTPSYFRQEYLPAYGVVDDDVNLEPIVARHAAMLSLIEREAPGKGRIFDIGAGAGFFLAAAARRGWNGSGVELSAEAAAFARERLGLDVTQSDAEAITAAPGTFDAVVMFDVIEHLFDPLLVLRSAHSLLRPNGVIVITTPNFHALSRWALGIEWSMLSPLEHLYYFTAQTLVESLTRAGFRQPAILRHHPDWGVFDTMNPRSTHAAGSGRSRRYEWFVKSFGDRLQPLVETMGKGDILLATAHA